jgi:hypothetical protein
MWGCIEGHPWAKVGIRVGFQVTWKTEGKMEVVATLIVVDKVKPTRIEVLKGEGKWGQGGWNARACQYEEGNVR